MTVSDSTAWSDSYHNDRTPWDLGEAHPELRRRLAIDSGLGCGSVGTAYVPGCGRGHDAVALADAGWRVIASDFAPAVATEVSRLLAPSGGEFLLGDSLRFGGPVDLWFDHTFFCAIPPARRDEYGMAATRAVRPGGRVVSIVFPVGPSDLDTGPPFSMTTSDLTVALGSAFVTLEDDEVTRPVGRRGRHRWAAWRRQ